MHTAVLYVILARMAVLASPGSVAPHCAAGPLEEAAKVRDKGKSFVIHYSLK